MVETVLAKEGTILNDIIKDNSLLNDVPVVLGKVNNRLYELRKHYHARR